MDRHTGAGAADFCGDGVAMQDKLFVAMGAVIFAAVAVYGIKTGRFKTREFKVAPYMRRRESPILFWTYATLLVGAALLLAYIAIFIA